MAPAGAAPATDARGHLRAAGAVPRAPSPQGHGGRIRSQPCCRSCRTLATANPRTLATPAPAPVLRDDVGCAPPSHPRTRPKPRTRLHCPMHRPCGPRPCHLPASIPALLKPSIRKPRAAAQGRNPPRTSSNRRACPATTPHARARASTAHTLPGLPVDPVVRAPSLRTTHARASPCPVAPPSLRTAPRRHC